MKTVLDLNGLWKARAVGQFSAHDHAFEIDDAQWTEIPVPGQWQCHPHFSTYQGKVTYRTTFSFAGDLKKPYALKFDGIFYRSTIYLNGQKLGETEGYFASFWLSTGTHLKNENVLVVEVDCAAIPPEGSDRRQVLGIFENAHYFPHTFNPGGIWAPVSLLEIDHVAIRHLSFDTVAIQEAHTKIHIDVGLSALQDGEIDCYFIMKPLNFDGDSYEWDAAHRIKKGAQTLSFDHNLIRPHLWWTHDVGFPAVYSLTVELKASNRVCAQVTRQVGLRRIRIEKKKFYLNDKPLFIRGANYVPTRPYLSRATPEMAKQDVQLATEANLNCVRIRDHVTIPAVYDACDRAGLLVWQDLPLYGLYAKEIAPSAQRQLKQMIHLLGAHTCLCFLCCHDEPFSQMEEDDNVWGKIKSVGSRYLGNWNRNILDTKLRKAALNLAPNHIIIQASGLWGLLGSISDVHFHWHNVDWWLDKYKVMSKLLVLNNHLVSDFGAVSKPTAETLAEQNSDEKSDESLAIHVSQKRQARILKLFLENLRLAKYKPIWGFFLSDLNDLFLTDGPGIVDVARRPKLAYDVVKDALQPNRLIARDLVEKEYRLGDVCLLPIFLINDGPTAAPEVTIQIKIKQERKLFLETTLITTQEADSRPTQIDTLYFRPQQPGTHELWLGLRVGEDEMLVTRYEIPVL